jgi:hypothetical protein
MTEIQPYELLGLFFGTMVAGTAVITGINVIDESVQKYFSQRREYLYQKSNPQGDLFPEYNQKPSFMKILLQETKDVPKNWKEEFSGLGGIFGLRKKKDKNLEDNLD